MKRKASQPSPYELPTKLNKRNTTATLGRNISTIRRAATVSKPKVPPVTWPRFPTLVPATKESRRSAAAEMAEISEEEGVPGTSQPSLRKVPTVTIADGDPASPSKSLSRTKSKSVGPTSVHSLSKRNSVVTLEKSGAVTTATRLKSGCSIGEMKSGSSGVRRKLSKASSTVPGEDSLTKRASLGKRASSTAKLKTTPSKRSSIGDGAGKEAVEEAAGDGGDKEAGASAVAAEEDGGEASAPAVPLPPGGLIEIVFSFDTTRSMADCLQEVRGRVGDMVQRLQADIPGIRIAVMAHGDYDDRDNPGFENPYIVKWIDFGSSLPELCDFVQTIEDTDGIDWDECYELAMARARTELSWTPGSQRSLVMIGDATPHPPSFYDDEDYEALDWKEEATKLADMGVKIYAVQAMDVSRSTSFYSTIARITKGRHLKLNEFNNIFDMIMAVCYSEKGVEFVEAYEEEVREREGAKGLHKDLEGMFGTLKEGKAAASFSRPTPKAQRKLAAKKAAAKAVKGKVATLAIAKAKGKAATAKGKRGTVQGKTKTTPAKGKAATTKGKGKAVAGKQATAKPKAKTAKEKAKAKASAKATAKAARGKGLKAVAKGGKAGKEDKTKKLQKTKKTKNTEAASTKPLKLRETVPDSELSQGSCMKVQWGPWEKAVLPNKPGGRLASLFKPRASVGFRNMQLCQHGDSKNAPAVYEMMADVPINVKRRAKSSLGKIPRKAYVLGYKACSAWRKSKSTWEQILLGTRELRAEVDALIKEGGRLLLRRGHVKGTAILREVISHINKHYDFAWTPRRSGKRGSTKLRHRRLVRCGKVISGNDALLKSK